MKNGEWIPLSKGSEPPHTHKHTHTHTTLAESVVYCVYSFFYDLFYFFHLKTHHNHFPMLLDILIIWLSVASILALCGSIIV